MSAALNFQLISFIFRIILIKNSKLIFIFQPFFSFTFAVLHVLSLSFSRITAARIFITTKSSSKYQTTFISNFYFFFFFGKITNWVINQTWQIVNLTYIFYISSKYLLHRQWPLLLNQFLIKKTCWILTSIKLVGLLKSILSTQSFSNKIDFFFHESKK